MRLPRRLVPSLATGALFAWSTAAAAEPPRSVRLVYEPPPVASCPDEASFRNLVAARLGYDPFVATSNDEVHVTFARRGAKLRARADVTSAGATSPSARELDGEPDQCEALGAALATTIAIALDPLASLGPASPNAPPPPPPQQQRPPAQQQPPPPLPAPQRATPDAARSPTSRALADGAHVHVFAAVGGVASAAVAPSVSFGGEAGVGLRAAAFSVEAEGRVEGMLAPVHVASGDRLDASVLTGALIPCANLREWAPCGVLRLGAFQGHAPDVANPSLGSSLYAAVGARLGYVIPLSGTFSLRPAVEVTFCLNRTSLLVDHETVWTAPPIAAAIQLELLASLS